MLIHYVLFESFECWNEGKGQKIHGIFSLQKAKEQGAVFIKDIWEENDEFGTIRMATVKTVCESFSLLHSHTFQAN